MDFFEETCRADLPMLLLTVSTRWGEAPAGPYHSCANSNIFPTGDDPFYTIEDHINKRGPEDRQWFWGTL